jgi:dihydroorotase
LLLRDGKVAGFDVSPNGHDRVIDAAGKIVVPGLIDMNVELREPGQEEDETIETGTAAALAGGFTSIACVPTSEPPIDTQGGVQYVRTRAMQANNCNVFPLACVSKERKGEELAEIGLLFEAGAVGFCDGGRPIRNAELLRRALEYCRMFDKPVMNRPEIAEISHGGVMHEGLVSLTLGLSGLPAEAEDMMTARDLRLAESTGGRLHLTAISTTGSVEQIRRAKSRGAKVTVEVSPQNFTLTDEKLRTFSSNYKVRPPLRSQEHIDSIRPGHLTWMQAIEKLTINPARVLGLKSKGHLSAGADADVTIIDPDAEWTVDARQLRSKSSNTPFHNWTLYGRAEKVIVGGEVKFE